MQFACFYLADKDRQDLTAGCYEYSEWQSESFQPELIKKAGARVLDDCPETYTLELTGANIHMDDFISEVGECAEILAVVRSGAMAITRGKNVLRVEI